MSPTNKRIVQPYLSFEGRCEEALEFYRNAIGAEVTTLLRYKDSPDPGMSEPASLDKVMHATLRIGESTVFASDGRCGGKPNFQGIWLALTAPDEADAQRLFEALAAAGKVQLPLTKTFFSSRFGIVSDRFGVSWMIQAAPSPPKG
jgi:PhnB protein